MRSLTEGKIQTFCILILTSIVVAASLKVFSSVLIPFVLAGFLFFCLSPLIDIQIRLMHVPRLVAILTTVLLGCIFLLLLGLIVSAAVGQLVEHKDEYLVKVEQLFSTVLSWLERFDYNIKDLSKSILTIPSKTTQRIFSRVVSEIMNVISNGLLVLIFTIFMLAGKRSNSTHNRNVYTEIESNIKKYTTTMLLTSGLTGFLVGLILSLLSVDFAWMFGFLTFLLNFIPNIGSVIAILLPVPVVVLSSQLSTAAQISAIAIPAAIQLIIGNFVQPKLMGQSLNLHPVAILLSLIFFGSIWGIVGMFLAVPITAVLKIFLEKFQYTVPVANLLVAKVEQKTVGKRND